MAALRPSTAVNVAAARVSVAGYVAPSSRASKPAAAAAMSAKRKTQAAASRTTVSWFKGDSQVEEVR